MAVTANVTAEILSAPLRLTLSYAERLLKDIPAGRFAHMPHPMMNHPAFCIGHLSLYPNQVLRMLGEDELLVEKDGWDALFKAGVACVEQDGRYPEKNEIAAHYFERYQTVLAALGDIDESVFARENPAEGRMKTFFLTIGSAANFYLNNHHMSHLGQISAWRRAVGLGPA